MTAEDTAKISERIVNQRIIGNEIKTFFAQQFPATKNVGDEDPLLKNGLIDSLGILEVVAFVEKQFGIIVSDDDLLPENFDSIHSLTKFVQQKTNGVNR